MYYVYFAILSARLFHSSDLAGLREALAEPCENGAARASRP